MATGLAPYKKIEDDGSVYFAQMVVEYESIQEKWKRLHPGEVWIVDVISPTCCYINSSIGNLYYIKRFKTQAAAEKWLVNQGADYLTRADYEWLKNKRKARA